TVWLNLAEAQKLLGKEGQVNAILALECLCEADHLGKIRAEVADILPDTQVIEFGTQALARAEARNRAAAAARDALERDKEDRARQRSERERLFALLVPLVLVSCAVWAGMLALNNVRDRVSEIGILRALGVRSRQILVLFLTRAAFIGLLGAALGNACGWLGSWAWDARGAGDAALGPLFDPALLALVLVLTPLFSALVSWIPALLAAQQDPADALREA
ncbi:MAG: FtsX-like permease family protein, partial [Planctomycetota bacterium]|nr:FtsX-like permease family protein [Planctomycetota bacterium]